MDGNIMIILSCKQLINSPGNEYILETQVVDTGIGISKKRQKMLFTPFLELKFKQSLSKVNDKTIGMGLSFSKDICCQLGGDIMIKHSEPTLTIFCFKIPVKMGEEYLPKQAQENTWKHSKVKDINILEMQNDNLHRYAEN